MSTLSLVVLGLTILLWVGEVMVAATINESDAAGNGLSFSFGVLMAGGLWLLIAVLLFTVAHRGLMPRSDQLAALLLVPASGAAAVAAFNLLRVRAVPAGWPVAIIALAPALAIGYAVWVSWPSGRVILSPDIGSPLVWGIVSLLAVAPWPALIVHARATTSRQAADAAEQHAAEVRARQQAARENQEAYERLSPDSPLWEWLDVAGRGDVFRDQALEGARCLARRQADAETMLTSGRGSILRELPQLDLASTPTICALCRPLLMKHAADWRTTVVSPPAYAERAESIEKYLPTMRWLQQHGCDLREAIAELETTVRSYPQAPPRDRMLAVLAEMRVTVPRGGSP